LNARIEPEGYPQKATDLPNEFRTLTNFQNDVLKFGRERQHWLDLTQERPEAAKYCEGKSYSESLWNQILAHKQFVATLNYSKIKRMLLN
jgi:hypothetical protein